MDDLPCLTRDLPGTGGRIKSTPEHFVVEEQALYEPSGTGEHVYLRVRREGRTTRDVAIALARHFGISERDVGYAGMKDKHARVTQTFSLPLPRADEGEVAARAAGELGLEVLDCRRHGNKLRRGHLLGNRFAVVVADVIEPVRVESGGSAGGLALDRMDAEADELDRERANPDALDRERASTVALDRASASTVALDRASAHTVALDRASAIGAALAVRGLANFYGPQRFGVQGRNAERGRRRLAGEDLGRARSWIARLELAAWQSQMFNRWLAERIGRGDFERMLAGDVAKKTDTGGLFDVEDVEEASARAARREITYTGPIYGASMRAASAFEGEIERELLARAEIDLAALDRARLEGTRRAARIFVEDLVLAASERGLELAFRLPKGAYATVLLREITKTDVAVDDACADEG